MAIIAIETDRLILRPYRLTDVDDLYRLWTDPGVRRYLWDDQVVSRDLVLTEVQKDIGRFAREGIGQFTAYERGESRLAGFCGFRDFFDPPQLQVLFGFHPDHWGKGLATEACRAMLRFGFEEHQLEEIIGCADVPNDASHRVMERAGMTERKRVVVNGLNPVYYGIARDAFTWDDSTYQLTRDDR